MIYFYAMNTAYLLLGGNMGDPRQQIEKAVSLLGEKAGSVGACSSIYRTAAWGKTDQPDFLNMAVVLHTSLSAPELMGTLLEIEEEMGRKRTEKNAPRIIDIDILMFNEDTRDEPGLQIPHPALPMRRFALVPLSELAAGMKHPVSGKTIREMLDECPDQLPVKKI